MSVPTIESRGNIYVLRWEKEKLSVTVSHLSTHSDRTTCELLFQTTDPTYNPHLFHQHFNLLAGSRSKGELSNELARVYPTLEKIESDTIIEQLCFKVLQQYRTGEPAVELWNTVTTKDTTYKIFPLIAEDEANLIFGDGGSGKSYIVLAFAILIQLDYSDNPLCLPVKEGRVLWLDWETSQQNMERRIKLITAGFGLPPLFIKYRYCKARLADDIEAIQKICLEDNINTLVIDSVGMSCGGDINNAEIANQFFTAFRSLNSTGIFIHHSSKADMQKRKKKPSPIGSIYFYNYPRNIWECRGIQEPGSDQLTIGLFHRKTNIDKYHHPLAFTLTFLDKEIDIVPDDPKNIPDFVAEISVTSQIMDALRKEKTKMSIELLAERLDQKPESIRRSLYRLQHREKVIKIGSDWGIKSEREANVT